MSVIIKDKEGKIILYCKGADSAVFTRLNQDSNPDKLEKCLEDFAKDGLRTLCIARRELSQDEYPIELAYTI